MKILHLTDVWMDGWMEDFEIGSPSKGVSDLIPWGIETVFFFLSYSYCKYCKSKYIMYGWVICTYMEVY